MEVSALKYSGGIGLHGRTSLLRLQSDERLIAFLRRGNTTAFDVLVARYESRLMAFCRHLLGSREDAEDVLQEVMTAAFNAILADDRPINVRPWLYRIARNRSLNHLRRIQAIGVDSMDHHLSEHGASTADKVHEREEFRLLVGDIHELPETQKTALVLREMDALSYEQIAEAMETTVPSVKSLLVRARVSLAEAAEARLLSCNEVRIELAEIAEGLVHRPSPLVRRHLRSCKRCTEFRSQLKQTNKALAALLPVGPVAMLHKLLFVHLGHSAGAGSGATAAGSTAAGAAGAGAAGAAGAGAAGAGAAGAGALGAGTAALAGGGAVAGSSGLISAGIGALAGKAAAGLAAAALVTAGAVEAGHNGHRHLHLAAVAALPAAAAPAARPSLAPVSSSYSEPRSSSVSHSVRKTAGPAKATKSSKPSAATKLAKADATPAPTTTTAATVPPAVKSTQAGRTQTQSDPTVLPSPPTPPTAPIVAAVPPATDPATTAATNEPAVTTTTTSTVPTTTTSTATATTTSTTPSTTTSTTSTTPTTTTSTTPTTTTSTTPTTTTSTTPTTTTSTSTTPTTTTPQSTTPAGTLAPRATAPGGVTTTSTSPAIVTHWWRRPMDAVLGPR
jgi:RNA polymerase sigma factor (sigma-70 family)